MYPRNAASPPTIDLGQILQLSDGAVQTSGASVRVKIGTGSWGAGAGSLDCDATSGIWTYAPTQAETNDAFFVVAAYKSGCSALSKTVITSASATAGYAGLDWSKINAPTTTVGLSGTTIKTATDVETDTVDIQSSVSDIETKVDTLLARITSTLFSGITYLSRWLGAIAGKTADTSTRAEINATTAGTSYNETTDSLEAVRDRGDAAWITGSSSDTGARTITITVNDGTNPLQGAKVRVRQGSENYVKETNASGVVEFNLDDFTWNVAITKPQYEFTSTTLVVNGSTSPPTYSMTLVSLTPSDADKVTGYWTVLDEEGNPAVGVVVKVNAVLQPTGAEGIIHFKTTRSSTTGANGVAEFVNMLPGWTYNVSLDGQTLSQITIDSAATGNVSLGSCVLAE